MKLDQAARALFLREFASAFVLALLADFTALLTAPETLSTTSFARSPALSTR